MHSNLKIIYIWALIIVVANASLSTQCPTAYDKHSVISEEYAMRIKNKIPNYGCSVIDLYAELIKLGDLYDVMDAIDDNPTLIPPLQKFLSNKKLTKIFQNDTSIKKAILNDALSVRFLNNLNALLTKKMNYAILSKTKKDPRYFNYFSLSAYYAKDYEQAAKYYVMLRNSISVEQLQYFATVLDAVKENYTFSGLMQNIISIKEYLTPDESAKILQYPGYIAYLLTPPVDAFPERIQEQKDRIDVYRKVHQENTLFVYKTVYDYFQYTSGVKEDVLALKTLENLSPYMLEQPQKSIQPFQSIMLDLIKGGFVMQLFDKDICSEAAKNNFDVFGQNNIDNLMYFRANNLELYNELIDPSNPHKDISYLFYVSNVYANFSKRNWNVFKGLLEFFSNNKADIYQVIPFLHRLEKVGYYNMIVRESDYLAYINASQDDAEGKSTQKYIYILATSYPSQSDTSIFYQYATGNFDEKKIKQHIRELKEMTVSELQEHTFTFLEKAEVYIDIVDYTAMAVCIVAAPITGGGSLALVSGNISRKVTQKTLKSAIKFAIKKTNKVIKYTNKMRKGVYNKMGKVKAKKIQNGLGKTEYITGSFSIGFMGGVFLFAGSKQIQTKNICEEIK